MSVPNEWNSEADKNSESFSSYEERSNGTDSEIHTQSCANLPQSPQMQDQYIQDIQMPIQDVYRQIPPPYGPATDSHWPAHDGYEQAQGPHTGHWSNFPYGTAPQPCQQWGFGPPPSQKTSSLAICSLVFSICGWIVAWLVFLPAGIVCGHCALHSVRKTGEPGEGMARAGLTLGYLGLVVTPLLLKWTHFQ